MRVASAVYTSPADLARLQELVLALPAGQPVRLTLSDGSCLAGIVAVPPVLQLFFGPQGQEGANALVRLEQPALSSPQDAGWLDLFIDRIVTVRHLDRSELSPAHPHP